MKARELIRIVEEAGGKFCRSRGDHRIYKLPNGNVVSIPMGGSQTEVSDGMLAKVRRLLKARMTPNLTSRVGQA